MMIRLLRPLVLLLLLLTVTSVHADEQEATAQLLYEQAMKAIDAGDYESACPKLEKSLAIEDAMGARFFLAECYEKTGRYASAWNNYVRVAEQAHREGETKREAFSRKRAEEVRAKVGTARLELAPATKALAIEVTRNGEPVSAALVEAPIPLDAGEHTFIVTAPDHEPFTGKVTVEDGAEVTLTIPALASSGDADSKEGPVTSDDDGLSALTIAGIAVGGLGVVGMAASVGIAAAAKSDYDAALDEHCVDGRCTPAGVEATNDARSTGNISTIVFGVGAGVTAVGVVLVVLGLTGGDDEPGDVAFSATPALDGSGGFLELRARF